MKKNLGLLVMIMAGAALGGGTAGGQSRPAESSQPPRTGGIVERVGVAVEGTSQYGFSIDGDVEPGFRLSGAIDQPSQTMYLNGRIFGDSPREMDLYWIGQEAYGFSHQTDTWHRVSVPGAPGSYLEALSALLERARVISMEEDTLDDERVLVLTASIDLSAVHRQSVSVGRALGSHLTEGAEKVDKSLMETMARAAGEAQIEAKYWIFMDTARIHKVETELTAPGVATRMIYQFTYPDTIDIVPPREALAADEQVVPLGMLLLKFDVNPHESFFGWSEFTHCRLTEETLILLDASDPADRYREIYRGYPAEWDTAGTQPYYSPPAPGDSEPGPKDHPTVVGVWAEDAWDFPRLRDLLHPSAIPLNLQTYRSTRHFGGEGTGLSHQDYFKYAGAPAPITGKQYVSARDWGWDGGGTGDKMNFQAALEAHNNYTYNGAKAAYKRMGHVLHLLQDTAQPDHAALQDHTASGMTDPVAYTRFKVCTAVVVEAVILSVAVCGPGCIAFGPFYGICVAGCVATAGVIGLAACEASIDSDEIGFEGLIREDWDLSRIRNKLEVRKEGSSPSEPVPYNNYFSNMQNLATGTAAAKGKKSPLGLAYIPFVPFILVPGLNPDITRGSQEADEFLELADEMITAAVDKGAGLLTHFLEIANHPPYIQEVVVLQEDLKMEVKQVGDDILPDLYPVDPDKQPKLDNVKYQARWDCFYDLPQVPHRRLMFRELVTLKNLPLDPTKWTYVVVQATSRMREPFNLTLRNDLGMTVGPYLLKSLPEEVLMRINPTAGHGPAVCAYPPTEFYLARIPTEDLRVFSCGGPVTLEVSGEDLEPHFAAADLGRVDSGKLLDSKPVTVAVVDENFPHDWIYAPTAANGFQLAYEPGADQNHTIRIILDDEFEGNDDLASSASLPINGEDKVYELSFHQAGDIDFFSLEVPINPDCKGAFTAPPPTSLDVIIPSVLTIKAEPEWPLPGVVFTLTDGPPWPNTFTPGNVQQSIFLALEDNFQTGKVLFSMEPMAAVSGKVEPGCYSMTLRHRNCRVENVLNLP
ncbi:MAG: hypothetical protein GY856_17845 [bacterium]|nr:hypothetical protein [bacterium]